MLYYLCIIIILLLNSEGESHEVTLDVLTGSNKWSGSHNEIATLNGIIYGRTNDNRVATVVFTLSGQFVVGQKTQFKKVATQDIDKVN